MNIYTSTQVHPYVYVCTHKITKEFYIGYREQNTKLNLTSDVDLPQYKTSSKQVKSNFDNYDWQIIAEFLVGNDAYDFEQQMIFENWDNPLLLNKQYRLPNGTRFKSTGSHTKGRKLGPQSLEACEKRSVAMKGKNKGKVPWNKGKKLTEEHIANRQASRKSNGKPVWNKGLTLTDEKYKVSGRKNKGKTPWNKGIPSTPEAEAKRLATRAANAAKKKAP